MRRIYALVSATLVAIAVGIGGQSQAALAAGDNWIDTVDEERQLVEFQAKAEAAGALGFYHDEETASLVVLVPPTKRATFEVRALGPSPVRVVVKISKVESADLQLARDRLDTFARGLTRGESLSSWFNPRSERLEVSGSAAQDDVLDSMGSSRALVSYSPATVVQESRFNDFSPFWGGSALKYQGLTSEIFDCTSGFAMTNGSTEALVTAAHCGPVNYTVLSPDANRVIGTTLQGGRWCPTDPNGPPSNNADVQLITGKNYDNTIYIGNKTGGPGIVSLGAGDPAVGATYAVSGAKTYEHTGIKVLSLTGQINNDACGVPGSLSTLIVYAYVQGNESYCPTQGGDSGAPFYYRDNLTPTHVGIRGMHIGRSTATNSVCFAMRYNKIAGVSGRWALTN